jgi:hypothetical protein
MSRALKAAVRQTVARTQPFEPKDTDTSSSAGFYRDSGQSVYVIHFAIAGEYESTLEAVNRRLRGKPFPGTRHSLS